MNKTLEQAIQFAEQTLREYGHLQYLFVGAKKDGFAFLPIAYTTNEEKLAFYKLVKIIFKDEGVEEYVAISAVWLSIKPIESKDKAVTPSLEDPQKQEKLIAIRITQKEKEVLVFDIVRDSENKFESLKVNPELSNLEDFGDDLLSMLKPGSIGIEAVTCD
jgi:hypothetical protein